MSVWRRGKEQSDWGDRRNGKWERVGGYYLKLENLIPTAVLWIFYQTFLILILYHSLFYCYNLIFKFYLQHRKLNSNNEAEGVRWDSWKGEGSDMDKWTDPVPLTYLVLWSLHLVMTKWCNPHWLRLWMLVSCQVGFTTVCLQFLFVGGHALCVSAHYYLELFNVAAFQTTQEFEKKTFLLRNAIPQAFARVPMWHAFRHSDGEFNWTINLNKGNFNLTLNTSNLYTAHWVHGRATLRGVC